MPTAALPFALQRPACVLGVVISGGWLAACGTTMPPTTPAAHAVSISAAYAEPEGGSGYTLKSGVALQHFAVAAANPIAADAGYHILKAGGSAVDAAIAVQMVLGLVEPQSSGIGGGALLLHAQNGQVDAYDGRETAPAAVTPTLLLNPDGTPMAFHAAAVGGRAVGTPGVVRMLEMAHQAHGKLPWAQLFQPAIDWAERGFAISPRLHTQLAADTYLPLNPAARAYFYSPAGHALPAGTRLKNPAYAQVLRDIATHGSRALHEGPVAQAMVAAVRSHPSNPGVLSLEDLARYQPIHRSALCHDWSPHTAPTPTASTTPRAAANAVPDSASPTAAVRSYRVCGFPPPSSGALAVGQILGMLGHTPAAARPLGPDGAPTAEWLHYYTEAARLAFADRAQYVADPAFIAAPGNDWHTLLAPAYLRARAQTMGPHRMPLAGPGQPGATPVAFAPMPAQVEYGTSHISIVDAQGHAVAMTSTIEDQFGSRQMVHGFLLNNQLTDFSFTPTNAQGQPIANRVQPGKRPRSSMAPTLVLDRATDQVVMSAGSPGGAHIIHYTAKVLQGVLGWGLTPQQAIALPNFSNLNGPTALEAGRFAPATVQALVDRGGTVLQQPLTSGLQAIARNPSPGATWLGGADPRREGVVRGD